MQELTFNTLVEQTPKLRQAGATHQCYPPHFSGSPDEEIQVHDDGGRNLAPNYPT